MRILVVDDEPRLARVLAALLRMAEMGEVATAGSGQEALELLRGGDGLDLVVTDLRMPNMTGLELLAEIRRRSPGTDVILMTAFAEVETAREALKRGALDYLVKPFGNDELVALVRQVRDRRVAAAPPGDTSGESGRETTFAGLVGQSKAMVDVFRRIERAARSDVAVLVQGESGTGKELIARAIHSLSPRHRSPFVEVDCVAIPAPLLESELFGHEKGAFTGAHERRVGRLESANTGTLFLDEVGEMPLEMQPKLLRFLQEHQFYRVGGNKRFNVDVRVIAATNRNLAAHAAAGHFRNDLYFRLDVFTIAVPPLRDRMADLPVLLRHLLARKGGTPGQFTPAAMNALEDYDWPGNVRELENAVSHALIEAGDQPVQPRHLPDKVRNPRSAPASGSSHSIDSLDLATNERWLIEQAIQEADGNKTRAAALLGITRRRLYSRMKLMGMELDGSADSD